MSNKAYVGTDGTILGGTDGLVLTSHTGNDEPATFEALPALPSTLIEGTLTTNTIPIASGAHTITNSILTWNGAGVFTQLLNTVNAAAQYVLESITNEYASFFTNTQTTPGPSSCSYHAGLDGTGFQNYTGYGTVLYQIQDHFSFSKYSWYFDSTQIMQLSLDGLSILGGAPFTADSGTWTPRVWSTSNNSGHGGEISGVNYTTPPNHQTGSWQRFGKEVTVSYSIGFSKDFLFSPYGIVGVTGIPHPIANEISTVQDEDPVANIDAVLNPCQQFLWPNDPNGVAIYRTIGGVDVPTGEINYYDGTVITLGQWWVPSQNEDFEHVAGSFTYLIA